MVRITLIRHTVTFMHSINRTIHNGNRMTTEKTRNHAHHTLGNGLDKGQYDKNKHHQSNTKTSVNLQ